MSRAYLAGANLSGADLHDSNLQKANLSGANLFGANLSDTDLSGTNLSGGGLSFANLSGANLQGTNLSDTDLSGANLDGALLTDAKQSEIESRIKKEQELLRKQKENEQTFKKFAKKFDNVLRKIGPTTEFLPISGRGKLSCLIDHVTKNLRKRPLYSKSPSLRKCVGERVWKAQNQDVFDGYKWYNLFREFVYGEASEIDKTTRYDKLEKLCGNCEEYTQQMILGSFCTSSGKGWCGDWGGRTLYSYLQPYIADNLLELLNKKWNPTGR